MIKHKLYNNLVKKNKNVCYEYERYVKEHITEHKMHRFRHLYLLIKLKWFYEVKKQSGPFLKFDDDPINVSNVINSNYGILSDVGLISGCSITQKLSVSLINTEFLAPIW